LIHLIREVKGDLTPATGPFFDIGSVPAAFNPKLVHLFIRSMNLTGSIPAALGLPNLTSLYLGGNRLNGTFPDLTATQLNDLELGNYFGSNNSVSGELFANLPYKAMRFLLVDGNQFSGPLPSDVGVRFSRLISFSIYNNKFNGTLPSSISLIRASSSLRIDNNLFTGCLPPIYVNATNRCFLRPRNSANNGSYLCCPAPALSPPPQICDLTYCTGTGVLPDDLTRFCPLPAPGAGFICVNGVWATSENVDIEGMRNLTINANNTVIVAANLTIGAAATVRLSSTSTIKVSECAQLDGKLDLSLIANSSSSKSFAILTSDDGCINGNFSSVTFSVEGCGNVTVPPTVTYTSASVLISFDYDDSSCSVPGAPGAPSAGANAAFEESYKVIIGAVFGGVLGLAIVVVVIILIVPAARHRVFPFLARRDTTRKTKTYEKEVM
jgi:hypothetical protein